MEGASSERASQRLLRAPRVNPKDQESRDHRGNQRLVARASRDAVDAFSKLVQGSLWGILQVNFREDPMLCSAGIGRVAYKYGGAARSDESAITGT